MNYLEGIIRYRNNGKHRYSCTTEAGRHEEMRRRGRRGTVWPLFLWLCASPLCLPPPVSFPFLHVYIIHITPSLMSLSLTLQCSSPSLGFPLPSSLALPPLPPISRLYLLLSPLFCAAPIRLFLLPVAMTLASCSSVRPVLRDETKELSLALFI